MSSVQVKLPLRAGTAAGLAAPDPRCRVVRGTPGAKCLPSPPEAPWRFDSVVGYFSPLSKSRKGLWGGVRVVHSSVGAWVG